MTDSRMFRTIYGLFHLLPLETGFDRSPKPAAQELRGGQCPLGWFDRANLTFVSRRGRGFLYCALGLSGLLAVSACSVADYKQPIDDMAGAVDQSINTINELDQEITAARNTRWKEEIADGKALLVTADDTCALNAKTCSLEIMFKDGTARPYPATSVIPTAKAGLAGLKLYVANLKAIVDADTVNQVTTSANAALGSLAEIETTIQEAGGPDAGAIQTYREPAENAINWLIGQYVDYVKFAALRKATRTAQPVIVRLSGFYDTISKVASDYQLGAASKEFVAKQETFDDASTPTPQAIDAYVTAAANYDVALRATSARPLQAFAEAHGKLTDELNGDISLSEAIAAIQNLVARAEAFETIVKEFKTAAGDE